MTADPSSASNQRRTQAERSEAMRKRLLAATLASLAEDGYTGSTLSSIVRRAGVSRGAQVHHYPNKQALILDAADDLLRRTYRALGALLLSIADEDDRLQGLVEGLWRELYASPRYRAYVELLVESRRDPALAEAMQKLLLRQVDIFEVAVDHYFVASPGTGENPRVVFLKMALLLHGIATHAHLAPDPKVVPALLNSWVREAGKQMRARKGVRTPPPRPPHWDR
jgi:AcrR family transcriptional regulator